MQVLSPAQARPIVGLYHALPERLVQRAGVVLQAADELAILGFFVELGHVNLFGALEGNRKRRRILISWFWPDWAELGHGVVTFERKSRSLRIYFRPIQTKTSKDSCDEIFRQVHFLPACFSSNLIKVWFVNRHEVTSIEHKNGWFWFIIICCEIMWRETSRKEFESQVRLLNIIHKKMCEWKINQVIDLKRNQKRLPQKGNYSSSSF